MNRQDIKQFLKRLLGPNVTLVDQGEWVSTNCPLAQWRHARGTDTNPSFGVKENRFEHSVYNCLTCHSKGTLPWLLKQLEMYTGEDYKELTEEVEEDEFLGGGLPEWDERYSYDTKNLTLGEPAARELLELYEEAAGHPYLKHRNITDDVAKALDLRYDDNDDGVERILFPVHSHQGDFYGYSGRAIREGVEPRVRDYFGLTKRLLLLGSEYIDKRKHKYILLVEGLFDFARGFGYGLPTVASLHSSITPQQADILKQLGLPVYVFLDDDEAGYDGEKAVAEMLVNHVPVLGVDYTTDKTFFDKSLGRRRRPRDPDELSYEQFLYMVKNAVLL